MSDHYSSDDGASSSGAQTPRSLIPISPAGSTYSTVNSSHGFQFRVNSQDIELSSISSNNNNTPTKSSLKREHSPSRYKKFTIKGGFEMPHFKMPTGESFSKMNQRIFHGRAIKKLRGISKRRKHRKNSSSFIARRRISRIMNSKITLAVMLIATFFMLFIDDLMRATAAPDNQASYISISVIKIIILLIFLVDMAFSLFMQRLHYLFSLFFIIDLISIASLIPDVIGFIFGISSIVHSINSLSVSRTARVARIASRLSRMARIINLFTFIQSQKRVNASEKDYHANISVEPSSIGRKLLTKSSQKIVTIALLIVLITTLTSPAPNSDPYYNSILNLFSQTADNTGLFSSSFNSTVSNFIDNDDNVKILYLKIQDQDIYKSEIDTSDWFSSFIIKEELENNEIWINNKREEQVLAALGITLTVCLIIILSVGTLLMSYDFQVLVIKPIERMVGLIKKISSMERGGGYDSDFDSETDECSSGGEGTDQNGTTNEIMMSSDVESGASDSGESFGGESDEPETNIIVELLSDIANKKLENFRKEKSQVDAKNQFNTGMMAIIASIKAYNQRKQFNNELKLYNRRARIVKEIFTTEQTYVTSLGVAIEAFLIPIRSKNMISADDINGIFSNIEVLHQFNQSFLEKIESKVNNWSINQSVGDVFSELDGLVDIYSVYINNYNNVLKIIEECKKDKESFTEFLLETRDSKAKGIDIMAYLIMPIQRSPRYVLLLEDLLKHTPSNHFDYLTIENAMKNLKKATVVLNERKRDSENKLAIQDIYMKLAPPVADILVPGNCVIVQSKLKQDGEKFVYFLFNSGFLKTERDGDHQLKVKAYLPIKEPIQITVIQDCPSKTIQNAFQLRIDENNVFLLFAKKPELRQEWIDAVGLFGRVQAQRTKSMLLVNSTRRSSIRGSGSGSPSLSSSRLSISSISKGSTSNLSKIN
eukprot:gene669-828_t